MLLKVPIASALTASQAREALQEQGCLEAFQSALLVYPHVDEWFALMALLLLLERHKGSASEWAPYVASLPREKASILRLPAEAIEALQCPELLHYSVFERELCGFYDGLGLPFSNADFIWGYDMAQSRAIQDEELPTYSNEESAFLVPLLDMLNHDPPNCCQIDFCYTTRSYKIVAQHAIRAGEQVFISYGSRPNVGLFGSYGFVEDRCWDDYQLSPSERLSVRLSTDGNDLLQLKRTVISGTLVSMTVLTVSDQPTKGCKGGGEEEVSALQRVLQEGTRLQAGFSTTVDEDERQLKETAQGCMEAALQFRICRKRTLQVLCDRLAQQLKLSAV